MSTNFLANLEGPLTSENQVICVPVFIGYRSWDFGPPGDMSTRAGTLFEKFSRPRLTQTNKSLWKVIAVHAAITGIIRNLHGSGKFFPTRARKDIPIRNGASECSLGGAV